MAEVCHDRLRRCTPFRRCVVTDVWPMYGPFRRCVATNVCHVAEVYPSCAMSDVWPLQEVCRDRGGGAV